MPDLETLLEEAAPPARPIDIGAIKARGDRWRRRRTALAVTAAVAVALVAVPFGLRVNGGTDAADQNVAAVSPPPPTAAPTTLERLPFEAVAVATDHVRLWGIGPTPAGQLRLAALDLKTGEATQEVVLPVSSASWAAFGTGYLWVGQAADGAEPEGSLTAVDAETLEVVATISLSSYAAAFSGDTAVVTSGSGDTVALVRVVDGAFEIRTVDIGDQPTNVAVSRSGDVWVQQAGGTLAQVDVQAARVERRVPWEGYLITGAEAELSLDDAVLAVDSDQRVVEVEPGRYADAPDARIRLRSKFASPAAADVIDGVLWASGRDGVDAFPLGASDSFSTPKRDSYSLAVINQVAYFVAGGGGGGLWRWQPGVVPDPTTMENAVARLRYVPSYVPDGYVLSSVFYRTLGTTRGVWIDVTYRPRAAAPTDASAVFSIHQRLLVDGEAPSWAAKGDKERTTVRGRPAFVGDSTITWAEGPNTLLTVGGPFTTDTLLKIAGSLEQATAADWDAYERSAVDR
jgi:hypothetical protein